MAEHPFAVTRDQYEQAMALARQMARERDERFEQLKACEAERDHYARALAALAYEPSGACANSRGACVGGRVLAQRAKRALDESPAKQREQT